MKQGTRGRGYVAIGTGLMVLIAMLEPLSSASVYIADKLANAPRVNYVVAVCFVFLGFMMSLVQFRKIASPPVRRLLLSYIFAAVGMAGIYFLIYSSHSGCYSFSLGAAPAASVLDFLYFSFVTVTTLGYGDIVPNHTFVRVLVVLQILFGAHLILHATAERPPQMQPGPKTAHDEGMLHDVAIHEVVHKECR